MSTFTRLSVAIGTSLTLAIGAAPAAVAGSERAATPAVSERAATPAVPAAFAGDLQVPAGMSARLGTTTSRLGVEPSPVKQALRRLVEPEPGCQPGAIGPYVRSLLAGLDQAELTFLLESGVLDFPFVDALLSGTSGDPRYAVDRAYRSQLTRSFRDAQRFWDVPSDDIHLIGVDGGILRDEARLALLLRDGYGWTEAEAADYAKFVVTTVAQIPELQGGDNPIFTLNAFAFSAEGATDPLIASIPDKIVMGDGLFDFFEHLGIADVGARAVLAHEFAHHVQFELGVFDGPPTAESTRRTELMADAFATYFATHRRGLALNTKRVVSAVTTFHSVGDCAFTDPGHHGTPTQRARAAQWGADLASSAQKQGHILPSRVLLRQFDAALPGLVTGAAR